MRIAIFADSKFRDTVPCVLLEKRLGEILPQAETRIFPFDLWNEVLTLFKPDVSVMNHVIGQRNLEIVRRSRFAVVVPTEGRPNTHEQEAWYVKKQDGVADLFLSWSDRLTEMFQVTKAVTVGNIRFDLYYDYPGLINTRLVSRAKYGIPENEIVFGVFTSFPQAKFSKRNVAFNNSDWKDLGLDKLDSMGNPLDYAKRETEERDKFLRYASFIKELTGAHLLVKPHPMEDVLELQKWCYENEATFVSQDIIPNVLAACDFVINRHGCMTTADALLMDVPVFEIGKKPDNVDGMAFMNTKAVNTIKDLAAVFAPQTGKADFNNALVPGEKLADEYIASCGGLGGGAADLAAKAIAAEVKKLPNTSESVNQRDILELDKLVVAHAARHVVPHPLAVPVGKQVTAGYVNSWRRKFD